jgi:hypothetical protein
MQTHQNQSQAIVQVALAAAFLVAGVVFGLAGWVAWVEHGFSATTIMALATVLGTVSLTLRSVRNARRLATASARRRSVGG